MRFYVGTYSVPGSPGIAVCEETDGRLSLLGSVHDVKHPTYVILSRDGTRLYAVAGDGGGEGVAAAYRIQGGGLKPDGQYAMGDARACFLALNAQETALYTANYQQGSLSVLAVDAQGRVTRLLQHIRHHGRGAHPARQEAAHVHHCAFRPGTAELFVCDLGLDRVFIYRASAPDGLLTETARIPTPDGTGPRHLVFAGGDCLYVAGELSSTVLTYKLEDGVWTRRQCLSTLPEGADGADNTCAAIRLWQDKVYVSNRGADTIAVFDRDAAGMLAACGHIPCHGQGPRDFVVTPAGFLCANQVSGTVTAVAPDGALLDTLPLPGAVCVCPA